MKTRHAIRFIITEWKSTESNRIRFVQPTYDNNDGIESDTRSGRKEKEEAEKVERAATSSRRFELGEENGAAWVTSHGREDESEKVRRWGEERGRERGARGWLLTTWSGDQGC